jgi:glycogen synthase
MTEHNKVIEEFYKEEIEPVSEKPHAEKVIPGYNKTGRRFLSAGTQDADEPIAIIGMSGRFPEAQNIDEMWKILKEGRNTIHEIPADRFDWRDIYGDPVRTQKR